MRERAGSPVRMGAGVGDQFATHGGHLREIVPPSRRRWMRWTRVGRFTRLIPVRYPAHTSLVNQFRDEIEAAVRSRVRNPRFLDSDIDCIGATLGEPITPDLTVAEYWFWNLRNTVRFDRAVATAVAGKVDTFVELAEHPTLQFALQENLDVPGRAVRDRRRYLRQAGDATSTEFTRKPRRACGQRHRLPVGHTSHGIGWCRIASVAGLPEHADERVVAVAAVPRRRVAGATLRATAPPAHGRRRDRRSSSRNGSR